MDPLSDEINFDFEEEKEDEGNYNPFETKDEEKDNVPKRDFNSLLQGEIISSSKDCNDEEARSTVVDWLVHVHFNCDHDFSVQEIRTIYTEVRSLIGSNSRPTVLDFFRCLNAPQIACYCNGLDLRSECGYLCTYLSELALLDYQCQTKRPSLLASAIVFVSRLTLNPKEHPWTKDLEDISGLKPEDLKEAVDLIRAIQFGTKYPYLNCSKAKFEKFKMVGSGIDVVLKKLFS